MNRKTNLFYLKGNDSNFLTFSNYTEYLTSVFLNTSLKMFMSKFIALNLPFDVNHSIENFKMFLMCYYENKLAVLRDQKNEINISYIQSLSYLFEAIQKFFGISSLNQLNTNDQPYIAYIGDITEHDYNGTYADSICIIDFNRYYKGSLNETSDELLDEYSITLEDDIDHLYGWSDELDNLDGDYQPIYDVESKYYYKSNIISLDTFEDTESNQITFNCIIPLFDVYNIDHQTYSINETNQFLTLANDDQLHELKNNPYGIWISEHNIDLYKDNKSHLGQSWSLVISSKFAPFPYGIQKPINATKDTVDRIEKYTYAQLLADQTKLYANFQDALNKIQLLQDKIDTLSQEIHAIATYSNIDEINRKLAQIENNIDDRIYEKTNDLREMISNLKWKNIE